MLARVWWQSQNRRRRGQQLPLILWMRRGSHVMGLLVALAGCSTTAVTPATGLFRATDRSLVELHVSPDQQTRGYLREGTRVAALSAVRRSGSTVIASAIYDDGTIRR